MRTNIRSNADSSAQPATEVRADGKLIRRVSEGAAETLVARGWAEWIGTGRRRYVQLTAAAPLSALPSWPGRDGTRPVRADHTCRFYADDQLMGDPALFREFPTTH